MVCNEDFEYTPIKINMTLLLSGPQYMRIKLLKQERISDELCSNFKASSAKTLLLDHKLTMSK